MNPLTGQQMYDLMSTLINGFNMDQTLFLQLVNVERIKVELLRPWMRLRKFQYTQTANPAQPVLIPFTSQQFVIPTDFHYLNRDGVITLYDNNNLWQQYTEVGTQYIIPYLQVNNTFCMDHGAGFFYLNGVIDRSYKVFIPYQANLGDITLTTTWLNIPSSYNMIIPLQVAARERLGINFDDINARNADDNARTADLLLESMKTWDDNIQRSATAAMDYPTLDETPANFNHKINVNG